MFNGSMFMGESSNLWQFNMFCRKLAQTILWRLCRSCVPSHVKFLGMYLVQLIFPGVIWKWKTSDTNLLRGLCLGSVSIRPGY